MILSLHLDLYLFPPPPGSFIIWIPCVSDHRPSAPTSAFSLHVRRAALCRLQSPTSALHHPFSFPTYIFLPFKKRKRKEKKRKEKKKHLYFSCLYLIVCWIPWSVTSSLSNDDGAAIPCPSRHPTASWVASRPPDGSRSTSKCRSPWRWHCSTGTPRCVCTRGPPSHSGWPDDGWNAPRCCNDWSGGSST